MKPNLIKLFSILVLIAPAITFATVRTVSNTSGTLAQFSTIQAAVNASSNGDTIYIQGSPNAYGTFTQTNKKLTFIGPGWSPDKSLSQIVSIPGCTITGAACADSEYQGLIFTSTVNINAGKPDSLRFIRNHFDGNSISINQGGVTYKGYLFEGNWFDNSSMDATGSSTYENFLIQNNIFFENATVRDGNFGGFNNAVNVLFDHNLWYGSGSSIRNITNGAVSRFLTFTNNIFVRRTFSTARVSTSTFNNNITFNCTINNPWANDGNVNAGGNIENQDPQMAAQAGVNSGDGNPIQNFTIAAGPANNTGSDGKDIGLLYDAVGSLNWTNSRNSRLPRIFFMGVTTPTVPAGGNVTINVDARISN